MTLPLIEMWGELKKDIELNLKSLLNDDSKKQELKEMLSLMLSMLNTIKIKQTHNEVNYGRKTKLETQ